MPFKTNRKNGLVALLATDKNQNTKVKLFDIKTADYLITGYHENKTCNTTSNTTDDTFIAAMHLDSMGQIDI